MSAPDEWRPQAEHLSILFDVFALGQRVRTLVALAMRDAGIRPDEYAAYSVLFESGPVTMTEMARELGMPVTTAADFVRAMQARGHVRRERHPDDGRAYLLSLTRTGLAAHRQASGCFQAAAQALTREMGGRSEKAARATLQSLTASAARAAESLSLPAH
jgi:DNA-binding MarR family transcriptional regulator